MSLLAELKQRKVFRVAASYAVVAWLLIQVAGAVLPALKLPEWTVTFTTVLLILGFPVALLLAWSFDVVRTRPAPAGTQGGIAVLPFTNMTGEPEQEHFADGIVEDLLTRLQANPRLKVLSRQSAFAYKGRSVDAPTIARELGCRHVVEGSVRKIGDRVRVTVQLIDAPTDQHVWAERYDRRLEDAFQLQDEICDHVVAAIESRVATEPGRVATAAVPASERKVSGRELITSRWMIPGGIALVAMAALLTWTLQKRSEERWAREEALPRLQALLDKDDYVGAFDLAAKIERVIPNDPLLHSLAPAFSARIRLQSEPAGANVYYRPYMSTESDWRLLGKTPLEDVEVPLGVGLWRLEKDGRATALLAMRNRGVQLGNTRDATFENYSFTVPLPDAAVAPKEMVLVPETNLVVPLVADGTQVALPAYYIDRHEVTNREYKEFVDARGYSEAAYWQDLPFDATPGGWSEAVKRFVDSTGRPGPATWEAGTYRDGTGNHPVSGVSWFEAAAYARFRGKELPTAYHWYRAANSLNELLESVSSSVVHASNFSGRELEPVGRLASIGPFGTYDMAGNVREWLWTEGSVGRYIAGGAYDEPPYLYTMLDEANPYDRSRGNGFRCMRTLQGGPVSAELRKPIVQTSIDFASLEPVGDDALDLLTAQLAYSPQPLDAKVERVASTSDLWTHDHVSLPTGYDDQSFAVHVYLPKGRTPPYQAVIYLPHSGHFRAVQKSGEWTPDQGNLPLDFVLKSGRALIVIAFDGSFERRWSAEKRASMSTATLLRSRLRNWRQDLGRTLDYLATRPDIDAHKLGAFGVSLGAQTFLPLLAVERRIGPMVAVGGGIYLFDEVPAVEQPYNFYPRITQPVLMLNGRWDIDVNLASQQRMLELLGTPAADKKHVLFEAGHGNLPRFQAVQASLDWYDKYLGKVTQ